VSNTKVGDSVTLYEELGQLEDAILDNKAKLDACDLLCYTYDSSDPESFAHIVELRQKNPHLDELPAVYIALKADQDKAVQRHEMQPDQYTSSLNMAPPMHVSVTWQSIAELFIHVSALCSQGTNSELTYHTS